MANKWHNVRQVQLKPKISIFKTISNPRYFINRIRNQLWSKLKFCPGAGGTKTCNQKMILKPRTLYCLGVQLRLASFMKVIPYQINPATGNLQEFQLILSRIIWKLIVVVNFAYVFFLWVRFYQLLKFNEFKTINKIHFAIHLSWCIGYLILIAGHLAICLYKDEIMEFINRFYSYLEKMEGKYGIVS